VRQPETTGHPRLVFTGKMDYRPNVDAALWFAAEILPRVRGAHREVEFHVVGQQPAPALLRLDGREGVAIAGAVADTRPHIAGAAVYVAPLRMGGGTRFKVLEAFALARPVVSTPLGAEGFAVASERELLLAGDAGTFAGAVVRLLSEPRLATRLGLAGQRFAREQHDWSVILPRLLDVYAGLGYPSAARIR
jgi:glycosyltransferase involved in cell wall biosynthesis